MNTSSMMPPATAATNGLDPAGIEELTTELAAIVAHFRTLGVAPAKRPSAALVAALEALAVGGPLAAPSWAPLLGGRLRTDSAARTGASHLLAHLGIWDGHDDVELLQSGLGAAPPPIANAATMVVAALAALTLVDATDLPLHSIDARDPHEIDDAIWAEQDGDDILLTIAVAMPARWIAPGSEADLFARARGTTLYHPRVFAPMIDDEAVRARGSLVAGSRREALLLQTRIDAGGQARLLDIVPAWVCVRKAWTYDEADAALAGPDTPRWLDLAWQATQRSESARISRGAWLLYRADVELRAPPFAEPELRPAPQSSPARRVVSEAMVLAGMVAARWFELRNVPAPFRVQGHGRKPPLSPGLYSEPADVQQVLSCLGPARVEPRGGAHAGLAASGYVQVGSPLRRYGDLLAQHQILASLAGIPLPFDGVGVTRALSQSTAARRDQRKMERRGRRYFTLLLLAAREPGLRLRCQVVDAGEGRNPPRAVSPDYGIDIELPGYGGPVGQWIDVTVEAVDPVAGRLKVRIG